MGRRPAGGPWPLPTHKIASQDPVCCCAASPAPHLGGSICGPGWLVLCGCPQIPVGAPHSPLRCTVLCCTALHCTLNWPSLLHCTALHCTAALCSLCCAALHSCATAQLNCTACMGTLHCAAALPCAGSAALQCTVQARVEPLPLPQCALAGRAGKPLVSRLQARVEPPAPAPPGPPPPPPPPRAPRS
jgi:hypothetical protein